MGMGEGGREEEREGGGREGNRCHKRTFVLSPAPSLAQLQPRQQLFPTSWFLKIAWLPSPSPHCPGL